jgi:hypothetical protein
MMKEKKQSRFRFSIRALIASLTIVAVGLGGWIAYSKHRIQGLFELRQQGAIVIVRDRTPQALQAIGISQLSPFFDVPTVELYVTPLGSDALVGNSETLTSSDIAQKTILEQASSARHYGAKDVQLILIDSFDPKWFAFAEDNSLTTIGDSKQRYMERLKANQESGANINP